MIKRAPEIALPGVLRLMAGGKDRPADARASYTGYARFALLNVLKLLGFGAGDRILLPAYICDVVLLPFRELGIEPVYYRVTGDFQVDWESVALLPGTRAFISVNYFGVSQDFAAIASFCEEKGLVWLNDNAHGFASRLGEESLEHFGDFSFTSFRKVIGSLNGARVRINADRFLALKDELDRLNGAAPRQQRRRFLAAALLRSAGIRLRPLPDFSDPRGFRDEDMMQYRLDAMAMTHLTESDEDAIRTHRRELYRGVERLLLARGEAKLLPVPGLLREGNAPLVLPAVAAGREVWLEALRGARRYGVDLHTWPSLPAEVLDQNTCGAADLWGRMLFFPLHQDLDAALYLPLVQKVLDAL